MTDATRGALDSMVAGIMEAKQQAYKGLTPVGMERTVTRDATDLDSPISGPIPADFPWDYPLQTITQTLLEIRRQIAFLEEGCRAIERAAKLREGGPIVPVSRAQTRLDEQAAKEAASDALFKAQAPVLEPEEPDEEEDFAERFAAQSAAAQVQVFTSSWKCPKHSRAVEKTSPRGRHYMACPQCAEFERP